MCWVMWRMKCKWIRIDGWNERQSVKKSSATLNETTTENHQQRTPNHNKALTTQQYKPVVVRKGSISGVVLVFLTEGLQA